MKKELGHDIVQTYHAYVDKTQERAQMEIMRQLFRLPKKYEVLGIIGNDAYRTVIAAREHADPKASEGEVVVIKKMSKVFDHKLETRQILTELRLLRVFKHPNVENLKEIILPISRTDFSEVYAVSDFATGNLRHVMGKDKLIPLGTRQMVICQILRGLAHIHQHRVAHRDLKPNNISINNEGIIQISNFKCARIFIDSKRSLVLEEPGLVWYQAPEILSGEKETLAVDLWSVGCILGEMIDGKLLFQGETELEQLNNIHKAFDALTPRLKKSVSLCNKYKSIFERLQEKSNDDEIDLLRELLQLEPSSRISAEDALNHPYFKQLNEAGAMQCDQHELDLEFEFEDYKLTTEQYKDLLYQQILLYHFPAFKQSYEDKKKNRESLISHIIQNSNSQNYNPLTDSCDDEWQKKDQLRIR